MTCRRVTLHSSLPASQARPHTYPHLSAPSSVAGEAMFLCDHEFLGRAPRESVLWGLKDSWRSVPWRMSHHSAGCDAKTAPCPTLLGGQSVGPSSKACGNLVPLLLNLAPAGLAPAQCQCFLVTGPKTNFLLLQILIFSTGGMTSPTHFINYLKDSQKGQEWFRAV